MPDVRRIDHIAILVEDLQTALAFWRDALGLSVSRIEEVPEQQAQIAFLPVGGSEIELVRPLVDDNGVARYLQKRGPGMHHLCLEVSDLDGTLRHLEGRGARLVNPEPMTAADGVRYAFIHPESAHGVLVELYELPRR